MNVAVGGKNGKHGGLATANVMVDAADQEVCGCIPTSPGVSSISQHVQPLVVDGNTQGVTHFVTMEEHQIATHVTVLQDFMDIAVDFVRFYLIFFRLS